MPGVIIGDEVIVGSGSVVTKNISSNCMVVGNPVRVIREDIKTKRYGQLQNE
jgi:acetyltransferase-like isoleucine patch superfamily enzyme